MTNNNFKKQNKSVFIDYILLPLLIFTLNIVLVLPLFKPEFTSVIASIESVFIAQGKFILENFPHLSWNSLWYAGFPFHLFYTPLPAFLEVLISLFFSISVAFAYRILTGISYSLIPVSLYYFVKILKKNKTAAFIAALLLSLAPSISYLLYSNIRFDALNLNLAPWRLVILTIYGEGPHTLSMVFLPLAGLFFFKALNKKTFKNILLASIFISLTALANAFGMIALALLLLAEIVVFVIVEKQLGPLIIAIKTTILSFGFLAFWYNISFFNSLFAFSDARGEKFFNTGGMVPFLVLLLPLIGFVLVYVLRPIFINKALSIPSLWLFTLLIITVAWFNFKIAIAPQGNRYLPEVDMAIAIILGILADSFINKLKKASGKVVSYLALVVFVFMIFISTSNFWFNSWDFLQPYPDITNSAEYKISKWLEREAGDKRVYITGNYAFWLNVFTNVSQLRGGSDQGATNLWWDHVTYQVNTGKDAQIAIAWLKAMNLSYIVVNDNLSANYFKDYKSPRKFEGILSKVYEEQGDTIYKVDLKDASLAKPIDLNILLTLKIPYNAVDSQSLDAYINWLEKDTNSQVNIEKIRNNKYQISSDLKSEDEGILVQITHNPGWRAFINEKKLKIEKDPLGFMILKPGIGQKQITLIHGAALDEWVGYAISLFTILFIVIKLALSYKR